MIGKFLSKKLKDHDVYTPQRSAVDLTNRDHVDKLFNSHDGFDLVIHCATRGGNRMYHDSWDVLDDNLKMYYNILHHKNSYDKLITFGSGAEIYMTDSPYGLSKKAIAKSILDQYNFYNIRIFGLFGNGELETRFIRSALTKYINKEPIYIHENKRMNFFYIEDLWILVQYYMNTNHPPKEVDCCYNTELITLKGIAELINTLGDHQVLINESILYPTSYIGDKKVISTLPLEFIGLEKGLKLEYEKYKLCNQYIG